MDKKKILLDAKMLCNGIENLLLAIEDENNHQDYVAKNYIKHALNEKCNALKRKINLI